MSAIIETQPAVFPAQLSRHVGPRETLSHTLTMAYRPCSGCAAPPSSGPTCS